MKSHPILTDLQKIVSASSPEGVWKEALPFLEQTGPHRFTLVEAPFSNAPNFYTNKDSWITQEWLDLVRTTSEKAKDFFEIAPVAPYLWDAESHVIGLENSATGRTFARRIAEAGYKNNLSVPVWGITTRQQGLLSVMTSLEKPDFRTYLCTYYSFLYTVAHIVHARLTFLTTQKTRHSIRLSRREKDCLLCLSAGLRNNRIAEKLGVSESTIEFHTVNARRKLSAKTREEAVSKALMMGLLLPLDFSAESEG